MFKYFGDVLVEIFEFFIPDLIQIILLIFLAFECRATVL